MNALVLAGFVEVFRQIIGVVLALSGLGVLLMGVIALSDKAWRSGAVAAGLGAVLLVAGLWLVGVPLPG
jgi:hypothetical protein